ncbi:stalk domain-containing protein [Paenibacillus sp. MBLB4367]|uniref:stalk domain-containing protein n=1 Tax=Paenibacillus sp. MBLB4367 TaxID=3384767 RepID=UPI003908124B
MPVILLCNEKAVLPASSKNEAVLDGNIVELEQPPMINYEYTYVPLRLLGEAANRKVTWKQEIQTALISLKDTKDTLYFDKGTIKYKGDLTDGKRHGKGTSYSEENGMVLYIGEWKNDAMDGKGQLYYSFSSDLFFEGTMVGGKQAEGVEYFPGGAKRYEGTYNKGLQYNGVVTRLFNPSGEYLIAELHEGQLNGKGTLYFSNGTVKSEGTYSNGVMLKGKLYDQNGKLIYEGEFDTKGDPKRP